MPKVLSRMPPGPRGLPLLGVTIDLRRDPLGFLRRVAREYGDVVYFPLFLQSRVLLGYPDDIEQVLVVQQQKFHKGRLMKEATHRVLGQGLLTSESEFWRRQRRLVQPAFQRPRITDYAPVVVELARAHIETWSDGEARDLVEEMLQITMSIAVKTLFGLELKEEAVAIGQALTTVTRYEMRRLRSPFHVPVNLPTKIRRHAEKAYQFLDSVVYGIIAERRAHHEQGSDLLSKLINATDEDGTQMTPRQLRDETMTILLAGYETTALTLSWLWYLLGENPRTELCLHDELGHVLAGRLPSLEDLERLPYLDGVIKETMRLYPPAYILGRTAIEPFGIGAYFFPAGTTVLMSQWVVHRDPRFFTDPLVFRPERWLDGLAERLPAFAYFPFGGGPRRCIGQGFGLMEAALAAATLAQRYRFRPVPDHLVVPEQLVTLRPKHGIRMTVHARA
jgi:cytochrome P450